MPRAKTEMAAPQTSLPELEVGKSYNILFRPGNELGDNTKKQFGEMRPVGPFHLFEISPAGWFGFRITAMGLGMNLQVYPQWIEEIQPAD